MFTFNLIKTYADGSVYSTTPITNIINSVELEESVGDELYIRGGDLRLQTTTEIVHTHTLTELCWIGVYRNGTLMNVYFLENADKSFNYLTRVYEYNLISASAKLFNDLHNTVLQHNTTSTVWNYALSQSALAIESVKVKYDDGYSTAANRYGFSVGDIIKNLAGKHNFGYYAIGTVTNDSVPVMTDDNLPILVRGVGPAIADFTLNEAIDYTFYQQFGEDNLFDLRMSDIFDIALTGWNSFLKVTPVIASSVLKLNLHLSPKNKKTVASPTTKNWHTLNFQEKRYKIDGVKISGDNFDFKFGNQGGVVLSKTLKVESPEVAIPPGNLLLYWVGGNFLETTYSGYNYYDILTATDETKPYADLLLLEPYYEEILASGNGIEGEIFYNGEQIFDQIELTTGGEAYQIINMVIREDLKTTIKAIAINS